MRCIDWANWWFCYGLSLPWLPLSSSPSTTTTTLSKVTTTITAGCGWPTLRLWATWILSIIRIGLSGTLMPCTGPSRLLRLLAMAIWLPWTQSRYYSWCLTFCSWPSCSPSTWIPYGGYWRTCTTIAYSSVPSGTSTKSTCARTKSWLSN